MDPVLSGRVGAESSGEIVLVVCRPDAGRRRRHGVFCRITEESHGSHASRSWDLHNRDFRSLLKVDAASGGRAGGPGFGAGGKRGPAERHAGWGIVIRIALYTALAVPVIDAHIHAYAEEVFPDPLGWGRARGEVWWTECVAPLRKRSLQGWATVDQLLRDMDAAGVDLVVMQGWYWERQATCDLQNSWFIDWQRAHPDRVRAFATVNPAGGALALSALERALDAGLCGVGELLPQVQGGRLDDDDWGRVFALAAARGLPVNLHVTDPLAARPGSGMKATPLDSYLAMLKAHPDTRFILAHWGGGLPFYELNPRLKPLFNNVFYDTAASSLLYDTRVFRRVADLVGAERILWGTDYPLFTHPKIEREVTFRHDLEDVRGEGAALSPAELELVLGGNAARLLRL